MKYLLAALVYVAGLLFILFLISLAVRAWTRDKEAQLQRGYTLWCKLHPEYQLSQPEWTDLQNLHCLPQ